MIQAFILEKKYIYISLESFILININLNLIFRFKSAYMYLKYLCICILLTSHVNMSHFFLMHYNILEGKVYFQHTPQSLFIHFVF